MNTEEIAEARRLYEAATADIPPLASDEEIDRRLHERTVAERTFMARMAPALLADLEQTRRGGRELGKTLVFLTELIKGAYLRGADDPIDALHMLGDHLAEVLEGEGGLSVDDFNRVYRALEERRKTEAEVRRLREENDRLRQQASASKVSEDILQANINALVAERDA